MTSNKLVIAALAGLVGAGLVTAGVQAAGPQDQGVAIEKAADKKEKEKHACKGQNSCAGNGADGKNACKGQGFISLPADTCTKIEGGRLTAE